MLPPENLLRAKWILAWRSRFLPLVFWKFWKMRLPGQFYEFQQSWKWLKFGIFAKFPIFLPRFGLLYQTVAECKSDGEEETEWGGRKGNVDGKLKFTEEQFIFNNLAIAVALVLLFFIQRGSPVKTQLEVKWRRMKNAKK